MAVGMIFDIEGGTRARYDQVREEVAPGNRPPIGLLYHAAGPTETGWRVVEVWESQEAADRFFHDTLGTALARAGMMVPPQTFEVVNTMQR